MRSMWKLNTINSIACDILALQEIANPDADTLSLLHRNIINMKTRDPSRRGGKP